MTLSSRLRDLTKDMRSAFSISSPHSKEDDSSVGQSGEETADSEIERQERLRRRKDQVKEHEEKFASSFGTIDGHLMEMRAALSKLQDLRQRSKGETNDTKTTISELGRETMALSVGVQSSYRTCKEVLSKQQDHVAFFEREKPPGWEGHVLRAREQDRSCGAEYMAFMEEFYRCDPNMFTVRREPGKST